LKAIGCSCYVNLPSIDTGNLVPNKIICQMVGYDWDIEAYRLGDNINKKLIVSKNVTFDENVKFGFQSLQSAKWFISGLPSQQYGRQQQ
jgi:hypothetical protein